MKCHHYLLLLLLSTLYCGCANIVPPDGGARDDKAPKLIRVKPADSSLNIKPKKIEFVFDEFIKVEDAANQVQVSPMLPFAPTLTVKARKVTLSLPDTALQANTTYTISLGNAIKDVHEGNAFAAFTYLFSTGSYFDSLTLKGKVINAATGIADTNVKVLLYDALLDRDVVVKQKPQYVTTSSAQGDFFFKGLPNKRFRIFALKENNNNLTFDAAEEWIAFDDKIYQPASEDTLIVLRIFQEQLPDSLKKQQPQSDGKGGRNANLAKIAPKDFAYRVAIDTSDRSKRTQDVSSPLAIEWTKPTDTIITARIALSSEQNGVVEEVPFKLMADTSRSNTTLLSTKWKPDVLYTLRLFKGFAKDNSGAEAMPGKYLFRTKSEEDYAQLQVLLPPDMRGGNRLLELYNGCQLVSSQPIADTVINFSFLTPGTYRLAIIDDKNGNAIWDTGDFKTAQQPEMVYPFAGEELLRAGWSHIVEYRKGSSKTR